MNETIAIIKKFEKSTKTLSANISIRQKVAGVTDFVNQDCHIEYQKPGYLKMNFKGLYPYTVIVSNGEVHTTIENEEDIRPLSPDENIFEHFLGIGYFKDIKKYNMRFRTEGDLYILKGEMPIKYLFSMQKDVIANAYKTIFMEIWLNPITGKIEKSHVKSFGGRDITYTYREQWINKKEKKKKRRQKDVSQKNENKL
ncbi:MAG: hypothetical protein DRI44_05580 [Chlamydiae bacterium]|nr:MAG: hypothetical protein DRI44_05580 [Chlamydiota bacterium]